MSHNRLVDHEGKGQVKQGPAHNNEEHSSTWVSDILVRSKSTAGRALPALLSSSKGLVGREGGDNVLMY